MTGSEAGDFAVAVAIVAMAAATYPMRAGGFWLMGRVPLTSRVRRMLAALPGAVVVATVVPIVVREGSSAVLAVAAAGIVMLAWRNDFLAVIAGMAAAIVFRTVVP
jgi:uncharacterized membrane protein